MLYKKTILAVVAFLVIEKGWSQQLLSLALLAEQPQSSMTNPAFLPQKKWTILGPSAWADARLSDGFSFNALIHDDASGKPIFDVEKALSGKSSFLNFHGKWGADFFQVQRRMGNWAFSLGQSTRFVAHLGIAKQNIELFWKGNGAFVGQKIRIAPTIRASGFRQTTFSAAYKIEKATIGFRPKLFWGGTSLNAYNSGDNGLTFQTDDDIYQLHVSGKYSFITAGELLKVDTAGKYGFEIGLKKPTAKGSGGLGGAFDMGIRYDFSKKWSAGASFLDAFGKIGWKKAQKNSTQIDIVYEGIEFDAADILNSKGLSVGSKLDSIQNLLQFEQTEVEHKIKFSPTMYLDGRFEPNEKWQFFAAIWVFESETAATIAARRHFLKERLSVGLLPIWNSESGVSVGANLTARLGFLNLFAASDNVFSAFQPFKTDRANFALGISAAF